MGIPDRAALRADCTSCAALCCVAPAFSASADFAIDKPAGRACPNLQADFRCGIHTNLRQRGFPGCTVYDCFGAGQRVTQVTFAGQDWRGTPAVASRMFGVFAVVRTLHELLWYLAEARELPAARPLHTDLDRRLEQTARLAELGPDELAGLDIDGHRHDVSELLLRASELVRARLRRKTAELRGADLVGRGFRGADLAGANLRGAYLIGADLSGADLRLADLIGADLRAADLSGATLATSLFLTQFQVNAAIGDARTTLPPALTRPPHWAG